MKKMFILMGIAFVIICGVIMTILGCMYINKSNDEAHSYQEIAEAYVTQEGITYDDCVVVKVYTNEEYDDEYMVIGVYEDGEFTNWIDVDVSYAENMAF